MRYFLDTEFEERTLTLLSIGVVAQDGRLFYAVTTEWEEADLSSWLRENVVPKLHRPPGYGGALVADYKTVGAELVEFVGVEKPEFWGWYSAYDWTIVCRRLFGALLRLPDHWPHHCLDLRQTIHHLDLDKDLLPPKPEDAHNALADALWVKESFEAIPRLAQGRVGQGYDDRGTWSIEPVVRR